MKRKKKSCETIASVEYIYLFRSFLYSTDAACSLYKILKNKLVARKNYINKQKSHFFTQIFLLQTRVIDFRIRISRNEKWDPFPNDSWIYNPG